jgi:hypothetical protein
MGIKITNNAYSELAAGLSTSATSITLTTGTGSRFPTLGAGDYFWGTIVAENNVDLMEIVKVTARSGDTLTVVRAQEGTVAGVWSTNDKFQLRITAQTMLDYSDVAHLTGVLPIAQGGTGSTNAADARAALSVLSLAGGTLTGELYVPNLTVGGQGRSALNAIGGNIGATAGSWNNAQLELKSTDAGTVALAFHRAGYTSNTIEARDGNGLRIDGNFILHAGNYNSYALPLTGGTITGTVSINGGGSQPLNLTTSSSSPWGFGLTRSDANVSSRVFLHNGSGSWTWVYEHNPVFYNGGAYSPFLHSGNYSSYALPLTGGTITGTLYFTDTTNGIYKSGGRLTVRSESTDDVANFASYGLYLPKTGQTAGLYVQSPIEARGGLRIGDGAGSGTITVGADTAATANRLVQRDSGGDIYGRYFFGVHFNQSSSNTENPSIAAFWTNSGADNYNRKSSPAHVISQLGLLTTSNYTSYAPSIGGGSTIGGITYFSNGESINLYGIRGRFTNEYIHLYNKVGVGNPSGWGQGEGNTPNQGLSTYGGINVAYGTNDSSTFNGTLRVNGNTIRQGNNLARPIANWSASSTSTGMVIFKLPGSSGNYGMVHMVFDIYEYNSNAVSTVIVGGHNWSSGWYNVGANIIGQCGKEVRLGYVDGQYCVVFGTGSSTWEYGTIILRKIHNASFYDNTMDMGGAFTASQVTSASFTNITGDLRALRTPASFNAGGAITQAGNQVLHAGNYNSYSPTLTGGGASGTWGINVTGSAASLNFGGGYTVQMGDWGLRNTTPSGWIQLGPANGSHAHIYTDRSNFYFNVDLYTNGYLQLHSNNYNSYAPTLTGGGASGTWGISITGNAATLQGYQWNSAGKDIRGSDIYADSWLRNYNSGTGLYNQATANHWYSDGQYWNVGYSGTTGIRLRNGHAGSILGYLYAETSGRFGLLNSGGSWSVSLNPADHRHVLFGGGYDDNAHSTRDGVRLLLGGGNTDAQGNYYIGTNFNNYGGNYTKLDLAWHTGIRIGAQAGYGGVRFYDSEDFGTVVFSVNTGDANVRVTNTLYSYAYRGNGNVAGTGEAIYAPAGVYSTGTNWLYGTIYLNGNSIQDCSRMNGPWTSGARCYSNEWIEFGNYSGLYSPLNGAHFYPNNVTYGSWRIAGSRNGWHGIHFDSGSTLMVNSNVVGFHREGYGWQMRWSAGTGYISKGDPGGGTDATILDSSNYNSYSPTLTGGNASGSWNITAARATRANGNFYIDDNYGNGIVGVYSSYRYQGVFAMGDSYKLPADGTTTGSLYGIAWSHPNAGGIAGNLTDHGMLIINNGGFRCAISNSIVASGNITAYSDERLKRNWRSMPDNFVERLAQVRNGLYERIDDGMEQVGVSAQSLQPLLPQAILKAKDEMGTLSVSYGNAAMASAVELAKEIVALKREIEILKSKLH